MDYSGLISAEELASVTPSSLSDMTEIEKLEPIEDGALHFDDTLYTPFEQFIYNISQLPDKPRRVCNYSLRVNGKVSQDAMRKYLADEAESSGSLKELLKSPRHYLIDKRQELPETDEDHFELGTFIHQALLEPKLFNGVKVEPKANRASAEGCREMIYYYWDVLEEYGEDISTWKHGELKDLIRTLEAKAETKGYTFVSEDMKRIINCIRATYSMYGDGILPKFFSCVKSECSMYTTDEQSGIKVKIRPDGLLLEENFGFNGILSLKSTSATTPEGFVSDCAKYKYELTEGMYLDVASKVTGRDFTATVMIMIQTVAPYCIAAYYWDAEDLEVGKYKYRHALETLSECRRTNRWLGFDNRAESGNFGFIQMKLPSYIKLELPPVCQGD